MMGEGGDGMAIMNDESMARRLARRLGGERATAMLEFAFMAPFVVMTVAFVADFTRILRTEQQLEIATRLAADVEAHMADYYGKLPCPSSAAKRVAKFYLVDVANVVESTDDVYMKGTCKVVGNPVSALMDQVRGFLDGSTFNESNVFLTLLGKILGGLMHFITFGTVNYILDVVPHDREVMITTAAYIPTVLPAEAYEWIGVGGRDGGRIGVAQMTADLKGGVGTTAWNLKVDGANRHRVYCCMPVMDSVPIAPRTYVRQFKAWCAKQPFLKRLVK